ncbi:MAG: beta-ketoacyl-[acyl-carrier-protein] synthase family protein [Thermoanaerobaculia bacterium]
MTAVVTGLGAVSSLGRGVDAFYRRLRAGDSAIRALLPGESPGLEAEGVARVDGWIPQPEIPAGRARRMDRGSQFAVVASLEAVRNAGYPVQDRRDRMGIALGTGSAGSGALSEFIRVLFVESPEAAPPFHFPNTIANGPASQVSLELNFLGPNVTVTQKDPSALNAAIYAIGCLEDGRAEAMIAGGVDEWNAVYSLAMGHMRALRGPALRSGIVQGEGCYVALLETEEGALARGAPIRARLSGFGFAGAPSAPYAYAPDPEAAERAMRDALDRAGADASSVDLVLLTRNGREEIDEIECRVLDRLFRGRIPETLAVKDKIGEMAAAGGAEIVAACCRLAEEGGPGLALVNSFGAGGNFISLVLERP